MDIRFTHTQPQQLFRLLELPPELLELLESENPPELCLKSSPAPSSSSQDPNSSARSGTAQSEFVNLCTPTKTFSLRQVNSSNSILLLKPPTGDTAVADSSGDTITTIAQCKSMLEVQKMDAGNSALTPLLAVLPVYDESDIRIDERSEDDDNCIPVSEIIQQRLKIFADIPFSVAECERAWTDICAFVYKNKETGALGCHRPSARAKLMAWEKMIEGATLHGIDLGKQFLVEDLWRAVMEEAEHTVIDEYPVPRTLFDAIVRRLLDDSTDLDGTLKWANFDQYKTAAWTGEVILEASTSTPTSTLNLETYTSDWKDLLPEQWRGDASIDKLNVSLANIRAILLAKLKQEIFLRNANMKLLGLKEILLPTA